MNCFTYHTPTQIIFGKGAEVQTGMAVRKCGCNSVLLLYGCGSAKESGLVARVTESLETHGVLVHTLGGVRPNPTVEFAQQAVNDWRDRGVELVLAVGGGSVIDTAKAVAIGLAQPDLPVWDYFCQKTPVTAALPVGVVLTIAAAGSETSDSAVLTEEDRQVKRGVGTPFNRPRFAIMNPELTYSLPARQTACGVADILMHTLDRYFAPDTENDLTDAIAEAVMHIAITWGPVALEQPENYQARSELMWCGSLSHNGLTGLGQTKDFSVHALGHELSAKFDLPHGESLSILWPAWAHFVWKTNPARFARLARKVWGVEEKEDHQAALAGIDATEQFFRRLGLPVTFGQAMGVQGDDVLRDLAVRCTFAHTRQVGVFQPLQEGSIYQIYRSANRP